MREEPQRVDAEYARISLDKRGAAEGVETQQAENADAAGELGLTIARSYVDNDLSAFSGVERPEYGRLLADIAAGKVGTLVIWHEEPSHSQGLLNHSLRASSVVLPVRALLESPGVSLDLSEHGELAAQAGGIPLVEPAELEVVSSHD